MLTENLLPVNNVDTLLHLAQTLAGKIVHRTSHCLRTANRLDAGSIAAEEEGLHAGSRSSQIGMVGIHIRHRLGRIHKEEANLLALLLKHITSVGSRNPFVCTRERTEGRRIDRGNLTAFIKIFLSFLGS